MRKLNDKKIKDLLHSVGLNHNLRDEEVKMIFESQFRFTFEKIKEFNLKELSPQEIDELKTNFYWKYIGKFYASGDNWFKYQKKLEILNKIKEENGRK